MPLRRSCAARACLADPTTLNHRCDSGQLSPHWWSNSCASDSAHVAAFEVDYGELFGFLGPNQAGTTTAVRKISQCASRANCGRNCGTRSQLPQSSSVSDRSRRSLAICVCRQGVRFCAKCCRSMLMSAKTEFTNDGVEHRGFEPRTPCLPGKCSPAELMPRELRLYRRWGGADKPSRRG